MSIDKSRLLKPQTLCLVPAHLTCIILHAMTAGCEAGLWDHIPFLTLTCCVTLGKCLTSLCLTFLFKIALLKKCIIVSRVAVRTKDN